MMGELKYILRFQVKQSSDGRFISQEKYVNELLKRFNMKGIKTMTSPMSPSIKVTRDKTRVSIDEKKVQRYE